MNPLIRALFSQWEWRLDVLLFLLLAGTLYVRGWIHLRSKQSHLAQKWRLVCYLAGLGVLAISLLSPIDQLGGQLFFMHMIQHLLSIMIAPPLLWLAAPFPIAMWGIPTAIRKRIGILFFVRASPFYQLLSTVTTPGLSWLIFIIVYLGWHEPALYNLALRRAWVHDIEHLTFFSVAMLYWWHVTGAAPRIHKRLPSWAYMAFVITTIPPNMLAGVFIAFAGAPIFTYYESVPRIWGFSVMQDQKLGGAIMWIPGSMMFLIAALTLMAIEMGKEENRHQQSVEAWSNEETMVAPGLEHRVIQNKWQRLQEAQAKGQDAA